MELDGTKLATRGPVKTTNQKRGLVSIFSMFTAFLTCLKKRLYNVLGLFKQKMQTEALRSSLVPSNDSNFPQTSAPQTCNALRIGPYTFSNRLEGVSRFATFV